MKIALCCIGKWENQYIKEYIEYYNTMGFTKIFIYDNNDVDGERYEEVISDYIENGFVEVIDFRGLERCQLKAYQDCHNKHGKEYDWIAYFDCDEFITLTKDKTIDEYLSREIFNDCDMVHLNWMCYSDNDLLGNENIGWSVLERFTKPVEPLDFKRKLSFAENDHIKSIIRGNVDVTWNKTPHTPSNALRCCKNNGEPCDSKKAHKEYNHELAYLKHYTTKTAYEYLRKVKRGFPDHKLRRGEREDMLNRFFCYNNETFDKKKILGLVEDVNENTDIFICAHKDFEVYPNNPCYKIIHGNEEINVPLEQFEEDETDSLLAKQKLYGEGSRIYWIWKHKELKDYVGFCHYSKYFSFFDDVPNMKVEFAENDVILPKILNVGSVYANYDGCHNIDDLMTIGGIISENYKEYLHDYVKLLGKTHMYPCNMFIMKKDDFNKYCEFVFGVLEKFDKLRGFNSDRDVEQYVRKNKDKYLKKFAPNNTVEYQARMGGFLLERLTNLFVIHNFKKIKEYPIKTTDNKYNKNLFN